MKHHKFLLTVVTALGLPALAYAVTLNEAQITAIVKDVKTIDPGKGSRPAELKETLAGEQSVRTGIESRSELLFNDHTITRLGANTHFSFTEGTRNMSLDSGVMLLQVPKGIGGAKIQTAAVTAAVTGTTIMIEAGKDYTKLIVLEGKCCLWPKNKKVDPNSIQSKFSKMKHEVCALAGQEIILRNGSTDVPDPVYVNLKTLESTSLLLNGQWGAQINTTPIVAAADGQGPDDYNPTNLAIVGAGTDVIIIQQQDPPGPPGTPPAGGSNPSNPPVIPPGKYGPLITITSGNPYTIGAGSAINTDPKITTNGVTDYGRIYRGNTLDGPSNTYLFGANSGVSDHGFDRIFTGKNGQLFPNYGIAAFKFTSLTLTGMPLIDMSTNGADDMVLVSEGAINIIASGTLDFTPLHNLGFTTVGGSIDVGLNTTIQGLSGDLVLFNKGAANNLTVDGVVNLPTGGFYGHTGGTFGGAGSVTAQLIDIKAGGIVTLNENQNGDAGTTTDTVNGVQVAYSANGEPATYSPLSSLTLSGNEVDVPNGFTAQPPGSEGGNVDLSLTSRLSGTFSGNINLSGFFLVNSLAATADNNITADSSVFLSSNNAINFTAGGNVEFDGQINNASDFIASGSNVTISSTATIYTSNSVQLNATSALEVDGAVTVLNTGGIFSGSGNSVTIGATADITADTSVQLNATNAVEVDGAVNVTGTAGVFSASGNTVTIGPTAVITLSGSGPGPDTLTGNTSVEVDGTIAVSGSVGVLNINGGSVTTGSTSKITVNNFTITAGGNDVTLDGDIEVGTLNVSGNNINTLSSIQSTEFVNDEIYASNSFTFNATNNVTFDGSIYTPSLTGTAGGMLTVQPNAMISSDSTTITASTLVLNGAITGYSARTAIFFGSTTTGGAGDVSGDGTIDARTISFNSSGDLNLDPASFSLPDTVNGIGINPSGNLVELDLTGVTVELTPSDAFNPSILRATATGGNLTVNNSINVAEFDGTAAGANQIVLTGSGMAITASGTINLAAGEILNQTGTSGAPVAVLTGTGATSLSLTVSTPNGTLSQSGADPTSFTFIQSDTGGNPIASGTIPFMISGSSASPTLTVGANSLTVSGTVDGSSFSSFALNLSSATDINSGTTATITAPTSVSLSVGVGGTIVGSSGSSTIDYNGTQLIIDSSRLSSFSLAASSIEVEDDETGFPSLSGSLSLTSNGTGGITVNTSLTVGGTASFIANGGGDISINDALTAGSLTGTSSGSVGITTNAGVTITGPATLTATGTGSININDPLSASSINLSAGGSVNTGGSGELDSPGAVVISSGSGISIAGDLGNNSDGPIPIGGDVTLTATTGNVSVTSNNVLVSGNLTLTASAGNVTFGNNESDLSIGKGVTLSAAGTVSVATDVTLDGALNITAGKDIVATGGSPIFFGATDVALTLTGTGAAISESSDGSQLNFGGAGDSVGNMIGVDLTGTTVTSINASGAIITLSGSFNVPVPLSLTATSGTVTIAGSGTVNASSFTANSTNGDISIGEPLILSGGFSGTASGGNIVINAPVNGTTFSGNASAITINSAVTATSQFNATATAGSISGTGSVSSPNVTLNQSGTAAVSQTSPGDQFSFNTLGVTVTAADAGSFASLQAGPLNFTTNLSLTDVDLTLNGTVNTNGHTISANVVTLSGVNTTTDTSGNATGLSVTGAGSDDSGNGVELRGVNLNGAFNTAGSGGTLTAAALTGNIDLAYSTSAEGGSTGGNGGTINLTANEGNITNATAYSYIQADGAAGGKGGTINLTTEQGDIDFTNYLYISANGGNTSGSGPGGNGGTITLTGSGESGSINTTYGTISANGGTGSGNGGTITLSSTGGATGNITSGADITANGGNAASAGAAGGNGGKVNLNANGNLTVNGNITATSGANGSTTFPGGAGGAVNLVAQGAVTVNSTIQVSSSDLVNNVVSAVPGNISVTSHLGSTGHVTPAINIASSAQLNSILNQAAVGPGGNITFTADSGGDIVVAGTVRADHGTVSIINSGSSTGDVSLTGATLSGDVVKAEVLSSNGTLKIGSPTGNTNISADTAIKLYSQGSGGVDFVGNTFLSGNSIKSIAGLIVMVAPTATLNITGGAATIYTNSAQYQGGGGSAAGMGHITGNSNTTTQPFGNRPAF